MREARGVGADARSVATEKFGKLERHCLPTMRRMLRQQKEKTMAHGAPSLGEMDLG